MARFSYKGLDPNGDSESGWVEGRDSGDAFATLQSRGIAVFELSEGEARAATDPWYLRDISLGGSTYPLGDQAALADLISSLSELGLPLTETLKLIAANTGNASIRRHIERTSARVADGEPLADAFDAAGRGFAEVFVQILRVAGLANTLPSSMLELATYLRRTDQTRTKVLSALIYPAILIFAACALFVVIVLYLAPTLAPMFASLGRPMPAGLGLFLDLGTFMNRYGWIVGLGGLLCIGLLLVASTSARGRATRARLVWKLPLVGPISRDSLLLRHVAALDMLLRSGMPLADALEVSASIGRASPFQTSFSVAAQALRDGSSAGSAFKDEPSLPSLFVELFAVGETVNRLPTTMQTVVKLLTAQLETRLQRSLQVLTPALTLFIGGLIGLLVYSVMGAMLDINAVAF